MLQHHQLSKISRQLRLDLLEMIYQSGSGHIGGCLSSIDILTSLYFSDIFNFKKDHFILSAGHLACGLYTVLAAKNYFPQNLLNTYSSFDSMLQGHITKDVPGVEYSSGSLGQGLSFAAGLSLGDSKNFTICLTTDGEHQEGQIWESLMFAAKYKLSHLINIVDCNNMQIDGSIEQIMPLGDLAHKYHSFGWNVIIVDGHSFSQITSALKKFKKSSKPNCLIAKTILGKGISYMENNFNYHDVKNLDPSLYQKAIQELKK